MSSLISGSNILITGGTFYQSSKISKDPFERLLEAASPSAFHDSNDLYDPPKCHPNTRVAVLNKIMDWIHGADQETRNALIAWLYGPAGSGKSAIARTIAEICAKEGILVASYFFSRFDSTRNHGRPFVATIAYQVSLAFPDIRDHIISVVDRDPFIFSRSLDSQMLSLITEPLQVRSGAGDFDTATAPRVIIVDGLDECEDRDGQAKILDVISKALQHHRLPFLFLISSRPEPDIRTAFGFGYLNDVSTRNPLDDNYLASKDIRLFLHDKFTELKNSHPFRAQIPPNWPSDETMQALVRKSSGQFIYASTVVKFAKSSRHRPPQRLEIILGIRPAQREMPFAELDALYMHIFASVVDPEPVMLILAHRLLSRYSLTVRTMERMLSLDPGDIAVLLCDLTSLIYVEEVSGFGRNKESFLRISHASLNDFLFDQSRSKQFWINAPLRCAEFAVLYLKDLPTNLIPKEAGNLVGFIGNAAPTPELRESIEKTSLASYLAEQPSCHHIPHFFTAISHWDVDGASFHNEQLQRFDHFAKGILGNMYADSGLTALVAIVKLHIHMHRYSDAFNELFSLGKSLKGLDKLSFSWAAHYPTSEYRPFILKFLGDPNRVGAYALTGDRYATAAAYFLKYINDHPEKIVPSFPTLQRKFKRQMNTPWHWRNTVKKAKSSEAAQSVQWQRFTRQRPMTLQWKMFMSGPAFRLALKGLAYVLPRSHSSEELTILARQHTFGPLVRSHRRSKKAVKREIARYLARVEQGGAIRHSSITT